jgi:hypothetical protein
MERYTKFFEKNEGSFLNGTQTGRKAVAQITLLLKNYKFSIMSRLAKTGWIVDWNGYEIRINYSPICKSDKQGFKTNIPLKNEEIVFKKGYELIKHVYPTAFIKDEFEIWIESE